MPDYKTVKRPPNYREGDYILRALYKLLDKQYGTRRKPSRTPSPYRPPAPPRPSSRGSGRASYSSQQRYSNNPPKENLLPKRSEPSYPRESRPYVQSLPQPRTEPDVDELLKQLEQRFDDRLVEQVMAKLDAESNAVETEASANPVESKAETEKATDSSDVALAEAAPDTKDAVAEEAAPEPSEPEPEPLDDFELDDLEWLDEEVRGLVVEAEDGESAFVTLEALEAGLEPAQDTPVSEPTELVQPELATPLGPLVEVDPLKQLEPGVAEMEEEVEDGEAEPP